MLPNVLRSRKLRVILALCLIFAAGVAVQIMSIKSANDEVRAAGTDRRTAEDLEIRTAVIENSGWTNWASEGGFALDLETASAAMAVADQSEAFYARRAAEGPPQERRIARRTLR